ncbi:MAG TPA: hypothetical protein VFA10_16690 [Ktedonobacteraceae bacterium]|nr:hypothetical protein [Ktedonobacteraceae bacterium]
MPKNPTYTYGVNAETLLVLAWCSTLNLRPLLQQDQKAHPWKYQERKPWDEWRPRLPADLLHQPLEDALLCFRGDLYGPVLQSLVAFRLLCVDREFVANAIGLEDMVNPGHALYYSDDPYEGYTVDQQRASGPKSETDAFWQAVREQRDVQDRLFRLSQTWQHGVCEGARALQTFFSAYPDMVKAYQKAPFFVRELLVRGLGQVDWHAIAANLLRVECPPCTCDRFVKDAPSVQVALFKELLKATEAELRLAGGCLPEQEREVAAFLSDLCRQAARGDMTENEAAGSPQKNE